MAMTGDPFPISVVVAAWPDLRGLIECLDSLQRQADTHVQLLVVSPMPPPPDPTGTVAAVRWLVAPRTALIPHLWSMGMAAATGEVVAITTAHFVPAPDWIGQIRAAHRRLDSVGIAGLIDPPEGGNLGDWATYFLRYSTAFVHSREQNVRDLIGDNASYKRAALQAHSDAIRAGFWEPEFHRLVLADGKHLTFVPTIRIAQRHSFGIRRFCSQRFRHGRQFGRDRMRGKSAFYRTAGVVLSPLIPIVLLSKILWRLSHRPALLPSFLASLPVLLLFICSWAWGELQGYLGRASPGGSAIDLSDGPAH